MLMNFETSVKKCIFYFLHVPYTQCYFDLKMIKKLLESGTTKVVLRWEGCVRTARVTERAGLFRVGARVVGSGSTSGGAGGAGVYALPVQELCAGAWAMRPLQDCKHARLPRTKTAHYFDVLEQG